MNSHQGIFVFYSRTEEEVKKDFQELSNHPMFMTEIPDNCEDNVLLQSLQALRFDGSADDLANEFLVRNFFYFRKIQKMLLIYMQKINNLNI